MSKASQEFLNHGFLMAVGRPDLKSESAKLKEPKYNAGGWAIMQDAFGTRILRMQRIDESAGMTVGQLAKRSANVTISNISSGTTNTVTTSGLTADSMWSDLLHCDDNNDSAGAAPEGEVGLVVDNSATVVTIDKGRPFSAAAAANDDFTVLKIHGCIDATDSGTAFDLQGIIFHGVSTQYRWGWTQMYGWYPGAAVSTNATSAGDIGAEGTAILGDGSITGIEDVAGQLPIANAADQVNLFDLVWINLLAVNFAGTAP
jgi:hypothetical protein